MSDLSQDEVDRYYDKLPDSRPPVGVDRFGMRVDQFDLIRIDGGPMMLAINMGPGRDRVLIDHCDEKFDMASCFIERVNRSAHGLGIPQTTDPLESPPYSEPSRSDTDR